MDQQSVGRSPQGNPDADNLMAYLDSSQLQQKDLTSNMWQDLSCAGTKLETTWIQPETAEQHTSHLDFRTQANLTENELDLMICSLSVKDAAELSAMMDGLDVAPATYTEPPEPAGFKPLTLEELSAEFIMEFGIRPISDTPSFPEFDMRIPASIEAAIRQLDTETDGGFPDFPSLDISDMPIHQEEASLAGQVKPKKKIRKTISAAVFYGFLLCMICGAFLISRGDRNLAGYSFLNVLSGSMQREIPKDSLVVVKKTDPNTIKIGDDITYMQDAETAVTHRVIGITENYKDSGARGFETMGIENPTPDFEIVPAVNVVGVVQFHIPKLGGWLEWLHNNMPITLIFAAELILFVVLLKGALKKSPGKSKKPPIRNRNLQLAA